MTTEIDNKTHAEIQKALEAVQRGVDERLFWKGLSEDILQAHNAGDTARIAALEIKMRKHLNLRPDKG